jgi:hypothetical protein
VFTLIGHLYLSGMWFGVVLKMNKKNHVELRAQNMISILSLVINIPRDLHDHSMRTESSCWY